jgi:hypothetical protein
MEVMSMMRVSSKITKRLSEYDEAKVLDEKIVFPSIQTIEGKRLWNENQYEDLFQYFDPFDASTEVEE